MRSGFSKGGDEGVGRVVKAGGIYSNKCGSEGGVWVECRSVL